MRRELINRLEEILKEIKNIPPGVMESQKPAILKIRNIVAEYLVDEKGKNFHENYFANFCFTNDVFRVILKEFPELR